MHPALVGHHDADEAGLGGLQLLGEDQRPDQHVLVGDALVGRAIDDGDLLLVALRRSDECLVETHRVSFRRRASRRATCSVEKVNRRADRAASIGRARRSFVSGLRRQARPGPVLRSPVRRPRSRPSHRPGPRLPLQCRHAPGIVERRLAATGRSRERHRRHHRGDLLQEREVGLGADGPIESSAVPPGARRGRPRERDLRERTVSPGAAWARCGMSGPITVAIFV